MGTRYHVKQSALFPDDDWHPNTVELMARRAAEPGSDERAAMIRRHREEWDLHLGLWHDALFKRSEPLARLAKLLAETLRIRQADERAALGSAGSAPDMDAETRKRRIAELLKDLGIGS